MKAQMRLLDAVIKDQDVSFNKIQNAYKKKFVSEIERSNVELNLLEKKMQRQSLYNDISSNEKIINLNDELEDCMRKIKGTQSENEKENTQLLMQMDGISSETESVIHAPVSGDIAEISKKTGDYINIGETILTIIPQGSVNNIVAFIPPAFIDEIKKGTKVALKYDSYPYQRFGVEHGVISSISKPPIQSEDIYSTFGLKTEIESFLVTINITKLQPPGHSFPLKVTSSE